MTLLTANGPTGAALRGRVTELNRQLTLLYLAIN